MIRVVWPEYIALKDWAAALTVDFPNENIPLLENEEKWQEWGNIVISTGIFAKAGIPAPFSVKEGKKSINFDKWQEWAKIVYNIMANEPGERNV
jgi:hypothetical protein